MTHRVTGGSAGPNLGFTLLADVAGLRAAHAALLSLQPPEEGLPALHLSRDRLFFVGRCARHCAAARERCNLPLMHTPEFGSAFSCERGSPMNPVAQCGL